MARSKCQDAIDAVQTLITDAESRNSALANDGFALCLGDILDAAGLSRNHLRRYEELRQMLQDHAEKHGLLYSRQGSIAPEEASEEAQTVKLSQGDLVSANLLRDAQKRLSDSERRCAELRAENIGLRTQLSRQSSVAELISRGGRIRPE